MIYVGQLIALRIDGVVIGITHEDMRRIGLVGPVHPGPQAGVLGVVPALDELVEHLLARDAEAPHRVPHEARIPKRRMEATPVVGRRAQQFLSLLSGQLLEERRVWILEPDAEGVVVDGGEDGFLTNVDEDLGGADVERRISDLVVPVVEDVFGCERMAVGPAEAAPQVEDELTVLIPYLPAASDVRHDRVAVGGPADEGAGAVAMRQRHQLLGRSRFGDDVAATVLPDAVDALEDDRLEPDSFGDRRQLALPHQLGEHGGFASWPPGSIPALRVVDILPDDDGILRVDGGGSQLLSFGHFPRIEDGDVIGYVGPEPEGPQQQEQDQAGKGSQRRKVREADAHDVSSRPRRPRPPACPR